MDPGPLGQQLPGGLDGFVRLGGHGRARCVLETHRVEGNAGVENLPERLRVERRVVGARTPRREFHDGDAHLVLQAGFGDAPPAVHQVLHVVQRVEIPYGRHAVFFEQLRVQADDVAGLRIQSDHVDAPGQRLQIGVRTHRLPDGVHPFEGVFVAIEIGRLEQRAAAGLEVFDARVPSRFHGGHEVPRKYARAVDGLKSVPERGTHEIDFLFHVGSFVWGNVLARCPRKLDLH